MSRAKRISLAEGRICPERQTGTGIREFRKANIRSLAAYELARRALRGECEPTRRSSLGEIPRTGHQHRKKKSTTYVVTSLLYRLFRCIPRKRYIAVRGDASFKKNEAEQ